MDAYRQLPDHNQLEGVPLTDPRMLATNLSKALTVSGVSAAYTADRPI